MTKPLTASTLRRLSTEGLISFLGHGERREISLRHGVDVILSSEEVADLNYVTAWGEREADGDRFAETCRDLLVRKLPFVAILWSEPSTSRAAEIDGLAYAVDFPVMVLESDDVAKVQPCGNPDVNTRRIVPGEDDDKDAEASAGVVASAFSLPHSATLRAIPPEVINSPSVDIYLANLDGEGSEVVGSVCLTYHGDICGVWCMATNVQQQKAGIGRELLSTAIADARNRLGSRKFFLMATTAGLKLYESLGFRTVLSVPVYVAGETHQS